MKKMITGIVIALVVSAVLMWLTGCSTSMILKECKQVQDEEKWVCKTIKPWE